MGAARRRVGNDVSDTAGDPMSNLRFALVGCGSIARKHAHVLHNYLDEAEIGAFVDLDGARACEFSRKFEAPGFTSVDEMMRRVGDRIDRKSVVEGQRGVD